MDTCGTPRPSRASASAMLPSKFWLPVICGGGEACGGLFQCARALQSGMWRDASGAAVCLPEAAGAGG